MRALGLAIVGVLVGAGCKGGASPAKGESAPDLGTLSGEQQLAGLIRTLETLPELPESVRAIALGQGVNQTIAPDDECFSDLGEVTGNDTFSLERVLACAKPCAVDAKLLRAQALDTRMGLLRTHCHSGLGIPADVEQLLSPELVLLARAGRHIRAARSGAKGALAERLDELLGTTKIPLPMPAWARDYRLPIVAEELASSMLTSRYLIITPDQVSLWSAPVARFGNKHVVVDWAPVAEQAADVRDGQSVLILADGQVSAVKVAKEARKRAHAFLGVIAGTATASALAPEDKGPAKLLWGPEPAHLVVALTDTDTWVSAIATGDHAQIARSGRVIDFDSVAQAVRDFRETPMLQDRPVTIHVSGKVPYREVIDMIAALSADRRTEFYLREGPPGPNMKSPL